MTGAARLRDHPQWKRRAYVLVRVPGTRQVYMLRACAGQRVPIYSVAEMSDLGRECADVMSVSVTEMTMLCELFMCAYDPVRGDLIL